MAEIIEQTRLLSDEEAKKAKEEFENQQSKIIKGNSLEDLLDNIDKDINRQ